MPVSIVTSLMLWTSLLAPASRSEPAHPTTIDRTACFHPSASLWSWPAPEPDSWTLPDADNQEEETGDGDPEGLASESAWLSPHLFAEGRISPIRRDRSIVRHSTRSPILRC
jgi:hypothetical protein